VQHLVQVGFHAGAFARGEYDGGDLCHGARHASKLLRIPEQHSIHFNIFNPVRIERGRDTNMLGVQSQCLDYARHERI
jgi:hypothetical protein